MRPDPKKIAVQMDGLGKLDISSDTTVGLIEEAVKRGHYVFMYLPETMSFNIESTKHLNIYAHCQPFINSRGNDILEMLKHPDKYWQPAQSEVPGKRNLTDFDIILMLRYMPVIFFCIAQVLCPPQILIPILLQALPYPTL